MAVSLFGETVRGAIDSTALTASLYAEPDQAQIAAPPEGLRPAAGSTFDAVMRWQEVLEGGVSTSVGAYGIITVLENIYGGRDGLAKTLKVSKKFLSQLGKLTSTGDARSGRKVGKDASERRPLTNGEERWIDGLISQLIYRSLAVEVGGAVNSPLTKTEYSLDTTVFRLAAPKKSSS